MALGFLQRTQSMISQVQDLIDVDDAIPAWVTSKLTSVYEDMNDVHAYMTQLDKFYDPKAMSEAKKKRGLWHNVWARVAQEREQSVPEKRDIQRLSMLNLSFVKWFVKNSRGDVLVLSCCFYQHGARYMMSQS